MLEARPEQRSLVRFLALWLVASAAPLGKEGNACLAIRRRQLNTKPQALQFLQSDGRHDPRSTGS
jgi:hypothetical protein